MAKQLNVSFKESGIELELYKFVKSQLSTGNYVKELILNDYTNKKNGITTIIQTQKLTNIENEETSLDNDEFNFD